MYASVHYILFSNAHSRNTRKRCLQRMLTHNSYLGKFSISLSVLKHAIANSHGDTNQSYSSFHTHVML